MSGRPGDGAQYRPDETWSELHAPDPDHDEPEIEFLDEAMHALPPSPAEGRPGPILAFRTDDIRVAVERLERRGVARVSDIFDETWGWCCYFKDPDGNDLEVFQYRPEPWPERSQANLEPSDSPGSRPCARSALDNGDVHEREGERGGEQERPHHVHLWWDPDP